MAQLRRANVRDKFMTLPSYEWHSMEFGDQNFYFDSYDVGLVDAPNPAALARKLRRRGTDFMIRRGDYKCCYYVGHSPQLFDLRRDPEECTDFATSPGHAEVLRDLPAELLGIVDPKQIDRLAKQHQQKRL